MVEAANDPARRQPGAQGNAALKYFHAYAALHQATVVSHDTIAWLKNWFTVSLDDGALPLATVEHIWREIITTFTRMQAPFDVAIDTSVAPDRMRDLARFYFGFSVALTPRGGPVAPEQKPPASCHVSG